MLNSYLHNVNNFFQLFVNALCSTILHYLKQKSKNISWLCRRKFHLSADNTADF